MLRARVLARAAQRRGIESGDPVLARERARIAAPLAGSKSVSRRSCRLDLSALYQIAYDCDDDAAACLEYWSACATSGSSRERCVSISTSCSARYELHCRSRRRRSDRGTRSSARDDRKARRHRRDDGDAAPAKALRAGWSGDFDAAQRLLRPTAEHQGTPARKASCWAWIALYCAAAGEAHAAQEACGKARDALRACSERPTQYGLALLTLALAALAGDDVDAARRWTNAADDLTLGTRRHGCARCAASSGR